MNVEGIGISIPVEFIQKRCPAMLGFLKKYWKVEGVFQCVSMVKIDKSKLLVVKKVKRKKILVTTAERC